MATFRADLVGALLAGASLLALAAPAAAQGKFQCPRKGGDFVFAQEAKANSLDQHVSSTISTRNIAMNMFESLMTRDDNMNPIPELAGEVIESPDKKTYTFKLRPGVKFHNGKALTSADVLASYNRYMKIGNDRGQYSIVEKYETPDPQTFVVRLKQAQPTFLENFSSFSVPVVIVPSESADAPPLQLPTIGTGPYQLVEFQADSYVKMKRYEGYTPDTRYETTNGFGGYKVACLDTVNVRFIVEPGARVAGLETGEFHAVEDVPAKSQPRLKQNKDITLLPLENFWVQIALTNTQLAPMDNLQFRQAVQAVLDMEEIMEAATDGAYKLNVGFQYPGQAYYTDVGKELYNQKNPAKAKQLLQQSGYKGERVILLTNRDYPNMYNAATMMAEQMKSIGIKAELLVLDWPATVNMYRNQDEGWHLFFTGWGTNTSLGGAAALRFFTPPLSEAYNPKTGAEDKELLDAFAAIENSETLEQRKAAFARMQKRAFEASFVYPFGSLTKVQAIRTSVEGFKPFRIPRFSNVAIKG